MSTSLTHFLFLIDKDCSSRGPDADYGTDEKTQLKLRLHDGLSRYLLKPYHPVKDQRHRVPATPTRDNPFQGPQNTLTGKPKSPPEQKEAQPPQDYGLPPRAKCASVQFRNVNLIAVGVAHMRALLAPRQVWNRPRGPSYPSPWNPLNVGRTHLCLCPFRDPLRFRLTLGRLMLPRKPHPLRHPGVLHDKIATNTEICTRGRFNQAHAQDSPLNLRGLPTHQSKRDAMAVPYMSKPLNVIHFRPPPSRLVSCYTLLS